MDGAISKRDLVGQRIGNFEITDRLGEGGMGVVYAAIDERLRRRIAMKVLRPQLARDTRRRTRFLREARFVAALAHPNVVNVYEVGEIGDVVYMTMELIEGRSLRTWLGLGTLTLGQSLVLARDIVRALARAHEKGIVHRDLKPDNVLVYEPNPGTLSVKVLDFGLAKAIEPPVRSKPEARSLELPMSASFVTAEGIALGTPGYMSPEQARGLPVDPRSDVYSFGILFYEMLTHQRLRLDSVGDPIRPSRLEKSIPRAVDDIVVKCLSHSPKDRFWSAESLLGKLETLCDALATSPEPSPPQVIVRATPPRPTPRRAAPSTLSRLDALHDGLGSLGDAVSPLPDLASSLTILAPLPEPPPPPPRARMLSLPELPPPSPKIDDLPRRIALPHAARPAALAVLFATGAMLFAVMRLASAGTPIAQAATPPPVATQLPAREEKKEETKEETRETPIVTCGAPTPTPPSPTQPTPTQPAPSSAPTTTAKRSPAIAASTGARPRSEDCATPFTLDENGIKVPKRQCLRR